jgi:hypothetical protein
MARNVWIPHLRVVESSSGIFRFFGCSWLRFCGGWALGDSGDSQHRGQPLFLRIVNLLTPCRFAFSMGGSISIFTRKSSHSSDLQSVMWFVVPLWKFGIRLAASGRTQLWRNWANTVPGTIRHGGKDRLDRGDLQWLQWLAASKPLESLPATWNILRKTSAAQFWPALGGSVWDRAPGVNPGFTSKLSYFCRFLRRMGAITG